ncbi:hypothetical protein GQ42DRAFT_159645 [Ramicandelaber brevisporus]|nr:hypothetical protein GQ42DRAFT_159645 [Ramicandelaber brevisporus]
MQSGGEHGRSLSNNNNDPHLTASGLSVFGNSRLFVLPYDLLEEIATTYFSRHEVVALLTVNSQFLATFSRTVWHTLNVGNSLVKHSPDTTWQKYGHLVRCASIEFNQLTTRWCARMPNLTELTLHLDHPSSAKDVIIELLSLRRIQFVTREGEWTTSDAMKCMDLVSQLEQYNTSLLIHWDLTLVWQPELSQ